VRGWEASIDAASDFFVGCALIIHLIIQTILLYPSGAI